MEEDLGEPRQHVDPSAEGGDCQGTVPMGSQLALTGHRSALSHLTFITSSEGGIFVLILLMWKLWRTGHEARDCQRRGSNTDNRGRFSLGNN